MKAGMHILLINPNTSQQTTALMLRQARACLPPGVLLHGATAGRGAAMITDEAGLKIAEQEVLRLGLGFAQGDDSQAGREGGARLGGDQLGVKRMACFAVDGELGEHRELDAKFA